MQTSEFFAHWEQVRKDLLATLEKFSEEELAFVPFDGSWPVGQIALHIADCEDNWIHGVVRGEIQPWIFYEFKDYPTKAEIVALLDMAHAKTLSFLEELSEEDLATEYLIPDGGGSASLYWILWHVLEHEIHHRGELSLIHGLLGREGLDV